MGQYINITQYGRTLVDDATAAAARTTLGGTDIGSAYFTQTNPGAVTYIRQNADNTITALSAANFLTAIGGGASNPFDDATAIIKGSADATKLLRFEVDGFTTGTTRVLTPPNANATIAGLEVAQTFTALQTFQAPTSGKAAVFKAAATTPGNIAEFTDSAGTVLTKVNSNGGVSLANNISLQFFKSNGAHTSFIYNDSIDNFIVRNDGPTGSFYIGNGAAGNTTGSLFFQVAGSNCLEMAPTGNVLITPLTASVVGLTVRGAASRSEALVKLQTSASGSLGNVGGCIYHRITDGASVSVDGTEDDLDTFTTVANTLAINGDSIEGSLTVSVAAHAASADRIQGYFAGIPIFDSTALTYVAAGTIEIRYRIIRVSSTTCRARVAFFPAGSSAILAFAKVEYTPTATLTGLTLTAQNILKWTGIATGGGSASGDITVREHKMYCQPFGS